MVDGVGEDVYHLLQQGFLLAVSVTKSRGVNNRKCWSCSKPLSNSIRSSLGARVHVGTNFKVADSIFSAWVTAKESIRQRGFASACASNYHNPGIRKYWSRWSQRS